jgi:hypothetical protein
MIPYPEDSRRYGQMGMSQPLTYRQMLVAYWSLLAPQVLGQILTGGVASAYQKELDRWVDQCYKEPLVEIQPGYREELVLSPEYIKRLEKNVTAMISR